MRELYEKVCQEVNVKEDQTTLYYGSNLLVSESTETLKDMDMEANTHIVLTQNLDGGEQKHAFGQKFM